MAENEQTPQPASQAQAPQTEKKQIGTLESVVDEISKAGKNGLAIAAGTAFPFMFSGGDRTNAMINAYPLGLGAMVHDVMAKKPIDAVKAAKESLVGTLIAKPLASLFRYIETTRQYVTDYAGAIPGGAAAVGALALGQAVFIGAYTGLNHIVQNFSFKGLYEKFKKDYWPTVKRTWKYVLPLSSLNVLYLYKFGVAAQLAYGSLMSFLFRLVGPKTEGAKLGNLVSAMNPIPYIGATFSVAGKLAKNLFYAPLNAAYAIGSSIRDLYKKTPKPAVPSPAAAPAQ